MNSGSYTWNITNTQLVNAICNANFNTTFTSEIFTIGNLKWQIILYPNGFNEKSKGSFLICIKLIEMPKQWKGFIASRTSQCIQTSTSDTTIRHFTKSGQVKGCSLYSLTLSELKATNPSKITIITSINIIKITLKNDKILHEIQIQNFQAKYAFKWTIDQSMFKQCKYVKALQSPIHNKIFRMRCYPGGEEFKGYVSIFLILCGLPQNIAKVKISYKLKCIEANISSCATDALYLSDNYSRTGHMHYSAGFKRFLLHEKVKYFEKLTFEAEIVILKGYDDKGKEIALDLNEFEQIQNEIICTKQQIHSEKYNYVQKMEMVDYRLDSLAMNIEKIQNNYDYMKQEIEIMKKNIHMIINEKRVNTTQFSYKCDIKQEQMKKWMIHVVELPQYIDMFIENGLEDMDVISTITMNELKMIGIDKIGHKLKILKAIEQFNKRVQNIYQKQTQVEGGTAYVC